MIQLRNNIEQLNNIETPFYLYDLDLLRRTINTAIEAAGDSKIHYAVKANHHPEILNVVAESGIGADCVSGNEVRAALEAGIDPSDIVFAGVGKTDREIQFGIENNIGCFNAESIEEIYVINEIAAANNAIANIAIRINPGIDALTHEKISTGKDENKFGVPVELVLEGLHRLQQLQNIRITGLHFHVGSQITNNSAFINLFNRVNHILTEFRTIGFIPLHINLGGGLGINYDNPEEDPIPDFHSWFSLADEIIERENWQTLHFEPGRSLSGQCGFLISRVLYTKQQKAHEYIIIDAGMTELIRPALYGARHLAENISSDHQQKEYEIAGPICESSDTFGKGMMLNECQRGDLIAFYSAGAYGESMASGYNLRDRVRAFTSEELLLADNAELVG